MFGRCRVVVTSYIIRGVCDEGAIYVVRPVRGGAMWGKHCKRCRCVSLESIGRGRMSELFHLSTYYIREQIPSLPCRRESGVNESAVIVWVDVPQLENTDAPDSGHKSPCHTKVYGTRRISSRVSKKRMPSQPCSWTYAVEMRGHSTAPRVNRREPWVAATGAHGHPNRNVISIRRTK